MSSIATTSGSSAARPYRAPIPAMHAVAGSVIFRAGERGPSWRIRQGAIRLSRPDPDGGAATFAGIARIGDVVGSEVQLFGSYAGDAYALGEVVLEPWLEADTGSLLKAVAAAERRTAEAIALRGGEAVDRIRRLFALLVGEVARDRVPVFIPTLRDIADMTGLTQETVSRVISLWRRRGLLTRGRRHCGVIALDLLRPASG